MLAALHTQGTLGRYNNVGRRFRQMLQELSLPARNFRWRQLKLGSGAPWTHLRPGPGAYVHLDLCESASVL